MQQPQPKTALWSIGGKEVAVVYFSEDVVRHHFEQQGQRAEKIKPLAGVYQVGGVIDVEGECRVVE